ncbi:MAG: 50S ribosomal protein L35 [Rhodobacteraceae bacterium]|nr:50S ribosomal protein L35 [Paracoccaceae bacterium]
MPKMKTKSSVKKRFRLTASGKVRGNVAYKRHCLGAKPQKMKRGARGTFVVDGSDQHIIKRHMPYG